jgi:hypothetical protein
MKTKTRTMMRAVGTGTGMMTKKRTTRTGEWDNEDNGARTMRTMAMGTTM